MSVGTFLNVKIIITLKKPNMDIEIWNAMADARSGEWLNDGSMALATLLHFVNKPTAHSSKIRCV